MRHCLGRAGAIWAGAFLVVGGVLFAGFSLGCMSLSIGGKTQVVSPASQDDSSAEGLQRGKAHAAHGQEVCIYYPVPYTSPPNLEFDDETRKQIQIIDQKPDHFRVKNTNSAADIGWKARGVLVTSAKAPATVNIGPATPNEVKNVGERP